MEKSENGKEWFGDHTCWKIIPVSEAPPTTVVAIKRIIPTKEIGIIQFACFFGQLLISKCDMSIVKQTEMIRLDATNDPRLCFKN